MRGPTTLREGWAAAAWAAAALVLASPGCQRRPSLGAEPRDERADRRASSGTSAGRRGQTTKRPPAGATCAGRDDCTSDQICVDARCRYRETSVSGEVLASAAEAQAEAGDWSGAVETYDLAFRAFESRGAPVPPEVACGAAELILRTATDAEARERGARRADLCFRITVPGDPGRVSVRRALARLRFEGLEIGLFDREDPAERFFTQAGGRPTVDAVQVEIQMPDLEPREPAAHTAIRAKLTSEEGTNAIADCFIQDWDVNHDRSATANLGLRYRTRLIDMGSYDDYEPTIEVQPTTTAVDGFEPCLARSLPSLFDRNDRSLRGGGEWSQTVRFAARIP